MTARDLKLAEVMEQLGIDAELLRMLEAEDLIHPTPTPDGEVVISVEDADRIRVIRLLTQELEVNLPGVEVILHMRDDMLAMQQQFDEILATLVAELRERVKR
jgi:MerR family transcriptional regulator/heat shock protein HspR